MQTNNQKIYYPAPGDTALAQTQMSMLATSVDSAITQTDGAQSARVDGVEATARALASTVATETADRKAGDEALAMSVNRMAVPDTGWRDIGFASTLSVAPGSASDKKIPFLHIRRIGNEVMVRGWVGIDAGSNSLLATIPTGFRAAPSNLKVGGDYSAFWAYQLPTAYYGDIAPSGQGIVQYVPWQQAIWVTDTSDASVLVGSGAGFTGSWVADDAFPDVSSLPGTEYTAPVNPNSSTSKVTVDTVNADLQSEKARSQQIDTAQGDRLTKLEAGLASEVSRSSQADSAHDSKISSLEKRTSSLETFQSGNDWKTLVVNPSMPGWAIEGTGVLVSTHPDGKVCSWTATVRRSAETFTIGKGKWFTVGTVSPAPSPKSGNTGRGVGQATGTSFEVQITEFGQLQVWSANDLPMAKGSGALNIAVNWISG